MLLFGLRTEYASEICNGFEVILLYQVDGSFEDRAKSLQTDGIRYRCFLRVHVVCYGKVLLL